MRLIDVCIDGGQRLGLAGVEADGDFLLLPDDRDVGDAWALYDRLGRRRPGYADTAAAHLARTMLEAFR